MKAQSVEEARKVTSANPADKDHQKNSLPTKKEDPPQEHPLRPTNAKMMAQGDTISKKEVPPPEQGPKNSWGGKLSDLAQSPQQPGSSQSINKPDKMKGSFKENKVEYTKNSLRDIATKK